MHTCIFPIKCLQRKAKKKKNVFNSCTNSGSTAIRQACFPAKTHFVLTWGQMQNNQSPLFLP